LNFKRPQIAFSHYVSERCIMRKIIISDIHGFYNEFKELLAKVNYNREKDTLYLLGDYVDKGTQGKDVIQYVMELLKQNNVKCIGGNHDWMFLNWLDGNDYRLNPYANVKNGGAATIKSFYPDYVVGENDEEARLFINNNYPEEIQFLRDLPFYIEDKKHIFVHAGIDPKQEDWKDTSEKDFRWIRKKFIAEPHHHSKTVVFGHTSCAVLNEDESNFNAWFVEKKIGIDGGIKFGGKLHALIIENDEYQVVSVAPGKLV